MELLAEFELAIEAFERAVASRSGERWSSSLWVVKTSDPWVWPKEGTPPVAARTEESIQVFSACWYVAAHCAFFLDFYLSGPNIDGFRPPPPFQAVADEGFDADGAIELPTWTCAREDVLAYIAHGREKARAILPELTEAEVERTMPQGHPWAGTTYDKLLAVDLAHVKEHTAQIASIEAPA
jgi:hypothetical protein